VTAPRASALALLALLDVAAYRPVKRDESGRLGERLPSWDLPVVIPIDRPNGRPGGAMLSLRPALPGRSSEVQPRAAVPSLPSAATGSLPSPLRVCTAPISHPLCRDAPGYDRARSGLRFSSSCLRHPKPPMRAHHRTPRAPVPQPEQPSARARGPETTRVQPAPARHPDQATLRPRFPQANTSCPYNSWP
jgi:hypothetical protein